MGLSPNIQSSLDGSEGYLLKRPRSVNIYIPVLTQIDSLSNSIIQIKYISSFFILYRNGMTSK